MKSPFTVVSAIVLGMLPLSCTNAVGRAIELQRPMLYAHEVTNSSMSAEHRHPSAEAEPTEADHAHTMVEVVDQPLPTVQVKVHPDTRQGWNLEVQVANFTFAPEHVNQAGPITEGHAHLYIDGVKITRLYGNWYYLESLAPGRHEITVSLNTNDHGTLMHNGQPIASTVMIDVLGASRSSP